MNTEIGAVLARESLPEPGEGLSRLRLDLGYDGAAYSGWARQPDRSTVAGTIAGRLAQVLRFPEPRLTVAGRTDAGVHARGQVAHVDVPTEVLPDDLDALLGRLTRTLPTDIRIHRIALAPPGFHARFSALRRHYCYRICDEPHALDPLRRGWIVAHPRRLDDDAMAQAAAPLLGEHDFAAYCRRREGATTVRTLRRLDVDRDAEGIVTAHVVADAFCHSMIRALMGALIPVGEGRRHVDWPATILAARERNPGVGVAPALGLVLESVDYPPDDELESRRHAYRAAAGACE